MESDQTGGHHVVVLTEQEALELCQALMEDFRAMTHARVTSDIDAKAKTESIVKHARWAFPLAESLKRTRGGLQQWPAGWFSYVRRVADGLPGSEGLKAKLAVAAEYAYGSDEIFAARVEAIAEMRKRRGGQ